MDINENVIEQKVSVIESDIDDINKEIKKLTEVISELKDGWDGVDARNYYEAFEVRYFLKLTKLKEYLDEYKDYLDKAVKSYVALDKYYSDINIEV